MNKLQGLAFIQGIYFLVTGLWPIIHMPSFTFVSGPKTDLWLVKTVGLLIMVIAIVLLVGSRTQIALSHTLLAVLSAAALGTVDVIYVSVKRIRRIYLLDAVVELIFILLWLSLLKTA